MCPAAARLGDPIAHTSILGNLAKMGGSLVAGALVGAALTVAAAAAVGFVLGTGGLGLGAVLALGFAVSVGMEASGLNGFIDRQVDRLVEHLIPPSIEGSIVTGSPDVNVDSLAAARAASPGAQDVVACALHATGAPPMLAQGANSVFINGHPAAREGDRTDCGGVIAAGAKDVFIGGDTVTVREIRDERPWWITALGTALGVALTLCGRGRMNVSALKSALPCLLMNMGASMGGSMVGHTIRNWIGNPVNVITGGKILREEPDFVLPGALALGWARFYSSHDRRADSLFGIGWSVAYEVQVGVERDEEGAIAALVYCDEQGRSMRFPPLQPGASHYSSAEGCCLICTESGQLVLETGDGLYRDFGLPDGRAILKLERLEDRNGNWHALRYDDGRLRRINDGCGRELELVYDTLHANRVAALRLARGADNEVPGVLVEYGYDAGGALARVTDRSGRTVREFAYRDALMVHHGIPGGLQCHYAWQGAGAEARVLRHWTNDGTALTLRYDLVARRTLVTDHLDRQMQWEWNVDCQPTTWIDAEGHAWQYAWDENRQLVQMTDPTGARTCCAYDALGRLVRTVNALGQIERTDWHDRFDLPVAEIDAAGNRWQYAYDERGNLVSATDPEGHESGQAVDARGLPHTIRDARGGHKHLRWNRRAQLVEYTDCSGKTTRYDYDGQGALACEIDALGHTTRYTHDAFGRLTGIVDAEGGVRRFDYDALGRLVAVVDQAGRSTRYERNLRGLPLRRIDAMGHGVDFAYDSAGRLVRLVNENGESYRFAYDRNDRLVEEVGLDGTVRRIGLDARGLAVSVLDAAGHADALLLRMERDALGRLLVKHARGHSTAYRYDQVGRLAQADVFSDDGQRRIVHYRLGFSYNRRGELTGESGHLGTLAHRYDELGNRCATTLPDGRTINRLHYGAGHLHQVNIDGDVITDIERDDLHREVTRTQGQLTTRFGYDRLGRTTWQDTRRPEADEPVLRKEWTYDRAGELVSRTHSRHGRTRYLYDPLGRILSAVGPAGEEFFQWDAAANLVDSAQVGGHVKYNRVTVFEDKRYEYDVHGRVEVKRIGRHTEQRFRYDGEHRLIEATVIRNGMVQVTSFSYDALGRRIRKDGNCSSSLFLWDGMRMLAEQRGTKAITYIYADESHVPLARIDTVGPATVGSDHWPGLPNHDLGRGPESRVMYFLTELAGNPVEAIAGCDILWNTDCATWGRSDVRSKPVDVMVSSVSHVAQQSLRFEGQYHDPETGLHYNTFRYYDPDIGRFITPDPIGLFGGVNLYQYAPNPLAWVDPLGWACWNNERIKFWKQEAGNNPTLYSAANLARMGLGKAPRLRVQVIRLKTRETKIKTVSMELHHATIPQRVGGADVHAASNLQKLTPWAHELIDPYRRTGERLVRIIDDIGAWK